MSETGVRATLGAIIWPVYLGAATGHPGAVQGAIPLHEPYGDLNYERGLISWVRQPDGDILGSAVIKVPAGVWTHYVWCSGFQPAALMNGSQMAHPVVFDRPGFIEVTPIRNQEIQPRNGAVLL